MTSEDREQVWAEQKKLCAARYVWSRRYDITPIGKITYEQWWEKMFNDNYDRYTADMMAKKRSGA